MRSNNPPRLVQTAYDWHSGQSSPLYSFASTGGVIWSADHRDDLESEILSCRANLRDAIACDPGCGRDRDARRLNKLLAYVLKAKIGYCYESKRMMPKAKARA